MARPHWFHDHFLHSKNIYLTRVRFAKLIFNLSYKAVQWVAGHFLTVFHDKIRHIIPYGRLHVYHSTSGVFLYFFATVSFILAFSTNWFTGSTPGYVQYLSFVAVGILALMVSLQVSQKFANRQAAFKQQQQNQQSRK